MVSSLVVICYSFQIEAGNYAVCVAVHAFYILYDLCRDFVDTWALGCLSIPIDDLVLDDEGTASNLAGGSSNLPPGLSLITFVFICTLPAWAMGTCAFYLSCPGFLVVGVESISISILNLFLLSMGGGVGFWFFFLFPLILKLIYVYFL